LSLAAGTAGGFSGWAGRKFFDPVTPVDDDRES